MKGVPMTCGWPVSYSACATEDDGTPKCFDALAPEDRANAEAMATEFLNLWTRQTFGNCPVALRPCRKDDECMVGNGGSTFWGRGPYPVSGMGGGGTYLPVLLNGQWFNVRANAGCGCNSLTPRCRGTHTIPGSVLEIPGPVQSVESIVIDGTELDPTAYRIVNYKLLVRQDGEPWPSTNDLNLPPTEPGTWIVNYTRGHPVPVGGQVAAGILACEFALAMCKSSSCALPQRIKNITRQGVTVTMFDNFEDLDSGRTGIWLIDSWVASVLKPQRRATVMSPDYRSSKRNSTPAWVTTWEYTPPPPDPGGFGVAHFGVAHFGV